MPVMSRMRAIAPVFIIVIAVLFILFMVISDSKLAEVFGRSKNNVGTINGKDITYPEFSQKFEDYRKQYRDAYKQDFDEDNLDQYRDQLWEDFIMSTLSKEQIEKCGITVSEKELNDIIFGPNPPDFLKKGFIDSTGNFRRDLYDAEVKKPQNKEIIVRVKEALKEQVADEKLQAVVNAAILPSAGEIKRKYVEQTGKMNAEFALVDLSQFPENTVTATNEEVKKYYDEHPDKFMVDAQRKLKYIAFPIVATKADSESVRQTLQTLVELSDTTSLDSVAKSFTGIQIAKDSADLSTIPAEAASKIISAEKGKIIGPIATSAGYMVYRVTNVKSGDPLVSASQILITGPDAEKEATKVYGEIKAGLSFEDAARKYSKDAGSAAKGGSLGWFKKGSQTPDVETAAMSGKPGEVLKPIKSANGYYIVKVNGKNSSKYFFEKVSEIVKPSASTKDLVYQKAVDFQFLANKNGFESECTAQKLNVLESQEFSKDAGYIPNLGMCRSLISFSFDNSVNSLSKPIKTQIGYVVAKVSEEIKPGVRKFEAVEKNVKVLCLKDKRYAKAKAEAERVKNSIGDDIAKATQVSKDVRLGSAPGFTTNGSVPAIGQDYNFAAEAYKAPLNKVIGPVKGMNGYYLIKVTQRENFNESDYLVQYNPIRDNSFSTRKQNFYQQWQAKLKTDASIVDRRYMFF